MDGSSSTIRPPERLDGDILRIKELSVTAKRVYSLIRHCQGDDHTVRLAQSWIAQRLHIGRQAVGRAVQQLAGRKLVRIEQRPRQTTTFSITQISTPKKFFLFFQNRQDSGHSESTLLIYDYLKYRQGGNDKAWPHIKTLCGDLGLSKSTVLRSLSELERGGYIAVDHAHGGLKQGNKYAVTGKAFDVTVCNPKSESGVSKCNTINNTQEELKTENTPIPSASQNYQEKILLLRQHGVAWPVAKSLAESHTVENIRNAILNAVAQCRQRRTNDPRLARNIKIAGYIVATLNKAAQEGHTVRQNSYVYRELAKRSTQPAAAVLDDLKAERLKALAAEQIRRLRAVVALEEAHQRKTGVA